MGIEVFPVPPSGPSLAEITSAITSNAAPATVTMPAITSSITTNAASSGVTMAAITSAITTNAASSGVTIAAITSAGNSAGWGAIGGGPTWTAISTPSISGGTVATFSGLSGYKYYWIQAGLRFSGTTTVFIRLNGDSAANYDWFGIAYGGGSFVEAINNNAWYLPASASDYLLMDFQILNASLTGQKTILATTGNRGNYSNFILNNRTITSPISSITINTNSNSFSNNGITLYGGN